MQGKDKSHRRGTQSRQLRLKMEGQLCSSSSCHICFSQRSTFSRLFNAPVRLGEFCTFPHTDGAKSGTIYKGRTSSHTSVLGHTAHFWGWDGGILPASPTSRKESRCSRASVMPLIRVEEGHVENAQYALKQARWELPAQPL